MTAQEYLERKSGEPVTTTQQTIAEPAKELHATIGKMVFDKNTEKLGKNSAVYQLTVKQNIYTSNAQHQFLFPVASFQRTSHIQPAAPDVPEVLPPPGPAAPDVPEVLPPPGPAAPDVPQVLPPPGSPPVSTAAPPTTTSQTTAEPEVTQQAQHGTTTEAEKDDEGLTGPTDAQLTGAEPDLGSAPEDNPQVEEPATVNTQTFQEPATPAKVTIHLHLFPH